MEGQLAARPPSTWTSCPPRRTGAPPALTWTTCSAPWTALAPVTRRCLPDGLLSLRTDPHRLMNPLPLLRQTLLPRTRPLPPPPPPARLQDRRRTSPRLRHPRFLPAPLLLSRHQTRPLLSCSDPLLRTNQPLPCLPTSPPLTRLLCASTTMQSMRRCCSLQSTLRPRPPSAPCLLCQQSGGHPG